MIMVSQLSFLHFTQNMIYFIKMMLMKKLLPRFRDLALLALEKDVSLTIDAEEQDRLTVSLDLIEKILLEKDIRDWEKIGVAVQAYGKKSF